MLRRTLSPLFDAMPFEPFVRPYNKTLRIALTFVVAERFAIAFESCELRQDAIADSGTIDGTIAEWYGWTDRCVHRQFVALADALASHEKFVEYYARARNFPFFEQHNADGTSVECDRWQSLRAAATFERLAVPCSHARALERKQSRRGVFAKKPERERDATRQTPRALAQVAEPLALHEPCDKLREHAARALGVATAALWLVTEPPRRTVRAGHGGTQCGRLARAGGSDWRFCVAFASKSQTARAWRGNA